MSAPQVHIPSISREALQVEGEYVYKLDPLACPPDDPALTAAVTETFPATQPFVERALASGARLDLGDADAAIVAGMCRKLDGVALAIELAARQVEAYGLQQTAAIRRGDAKGGVEILRGCLEILHAAPYELLTAALGIPLIQGLAASGQFDEGIAQIDKTIEQVETNGDLCYMPELLRVRGQSSPVDAAVKG